MKKNRFFILGVLVQALFFVLLVSYGNNIKTCYVEKSDYGVVSMTSPLSVRLQNNNNESLRLENSKVIIDTEDGLVVGSDSIFLGNVFVGDDMGETENIYVGGKYLIFKNGIFVGALEEPKDKEE